MRQRHRIQDIAGQSGLSPATVDRVLHGRPGVSARATRQVERALVDLDHQAEQLRLGARTLLVDVIMQAPSRFTSAVRDALESELGTARSAAIRARFDLREVRDITGLVSRLDQVGKRGLPSHGVLLKAPDHPEVAAAIDRLTMRGVPVVTLVTDVSNCSRIAYVGLDNAAAGATAAYLVDQWLKGISGSVLVAVSRTSFSGERDRHRAFVTRLASYRSRRHIIDISDTDGLDDSVARSVAGALHDHPDISGIYSIGGGNHGIATELDRLRHPLSVFVVHDLDHDNVALLMSGQVSVVLHHDLHDDMRAALQQVLRYHHLLPGAPISVAANVQVVTPFNVPGRWVTR